jgi:predicted RNA-binding Zn ribbon-like protein
MLMAVSTAAAPHDLGLVVDFVNTVDLETGEDALSRPDDLSAWLRERGLVGPAQVAIGDPEHRAAVGFREALRQVLRAHTRGEPDPAAATAVLERIAAAGRRSIGFAPGGAVTIAPRDPGYAGSLARLLVPVARAAADGTWERTKACDDDACEAAFYDRSRNRSGRWCDMAICGNRTKVRAYRSKQGVPPGPSGPPTA